MKSVGQLMTITVHRVPAQLSLEACQRIMLQQNVRHLLLVDAHGRHLGVVSDVPVLEACRTGDGSLPVSEVADPEGLRVAPSSAATSVLAKMLHTRSDHAVVLDNELRAVGLFTEREAMELAQVAIRPWTRAGELMTPGTPHHVGPDALAQRALDEMFQRKFRHLLVLDEEGWLLGVLSHRDLVGRWDPVSELATDTIYYVEEGTPITEVAQLMYTHEIGCLPVVDAERKLAGILTRTDVLQALARQLVDASAPPTRRRGEGTPQP